MPRRNTRRKVIVAALVSAVVVGVCSTSYKSVSSAATPSFTMTAAQEAASAGQTTSTAFCGKKSITLGIEDGFGINAWSQESMAAVRSEAAKCPNVKQVVAIGEGDLTKSISQINSFVAQGANAIVVIPDFGQAELPAIKAATTAGVKVVPWAADPGGVAGTDYVKYVDWLPSDAGTKWAQWMATTLHGKGNVVFTGGPAGNPVSESLLQSVVKVFAKYPGIHLLTGKTNWPVTNWDPATAQQVMSSLLAKYPTINGVISDYGTDALAETYAFKSANRALVPTASLDANGLACTYNKVHTTNANFQLATIPSRNWLGRVAARTAIAAAEGVTDNEPALYNLPFFENSKAGLAPKCVSSEPSDYYASNKLSASVLSKYGKV